VQLDPVRDTRLQSPADSAFDLASGFTLEMWILPGSLQGTGGLIGKGNDGTGAGPWEIATRYDALEVNLSGTVTRSPPILSTLVWQHIAVSWDPSACVVAFYRDGILRGTGRAPHRIATEPQGGIWVGGIRSPDYFPGAIAEVRLWKGARDAAAIYAACAQRLSRARDADSTLIAHWPLDDGRGTRARDASGHGLHLAFGTDERHRPTWFPHDVEADTAGVDDPVAPPIVLQPGFVVRELARLPYRGEKLSATIAIAPRWSAFWPYLWVALARNDSNMPWDGPDLVLRIDPQGRVERIVEIRERDADLVDMRFPPSKEWGDFLFLCANNMDGYQAWDAGGAILRIDPSGRESIFVPNSLQISEPRTLAFAPAGGAFPEGLYVGNEMDLPRGILSFTRRGVPGTGRELRSRR
jgi:hypothetical protein